MAFESIEYSVDDGVATVTLNRPDRLNAFTVDMCDEFISVFDLTDNDDAVRAVIVTGAGRGFCAGADLASGGETFERNPTRWTHRDEGGIAALRIFDSRKPVIGAVNGAAVGMGATICLPMDFLLVSTAAKFGFVFARRGITPDGCATWFLPRRVGISTAADWMYSGRIVLADEVHTGGLARSLHAPDELIPAAQELAATIAGESAPVSVAATRQMIWRMLGAPHPVLANHAESIALTATGRSDDAREGVTSFLEKRQPVFTGSVAADLPSLFTGFPAVEYPAI